MELSTLLAFCGAWAALVVLPGPDTALVAAMGITRDRATAIQAALGSCTAVGVHVTAAGLGLSAILASSAELFTALKLVGAAYLGYLGLRLILARTPQASADLRYEPPNARRSLYAKGLLTGLLNPKTAIFFLTFLPQFIDRQAPVAGQLAVLAVLTVLVAALWHAALILAAGRLRAAAARPRVHEVVERLTGTVFVVLASRLALAPR